jgi:UDP-glucose 4-epimerase
MNKQYKKNKMNQTIIVTGGAGYIGSHTIIELLESTPFEVISIDNFSNSSIETFDRIEAITGIKIVNHAINLCDREALFNCISNVKNIVGIIHFAAFKSVPESVENPALYYENNVLSLTNILEACKKFNIHNLIFSSSCSVYGNIDQLPVTENTPFSKAESPYAHTKQIGEQIIELYTKSNPDLKTIALRYFNPVGAHPSGKIGESPINPPTSLIPIITQTAIGKRTKMFVHGYDYPTRDGSCIRDYIHVCDIGNAHVKALNLLIENQTDKSFDVINLGTGEGISVKEAITSFETNTGVKLNYEMGPRREGDVVSIYSDTTKSEEILAWKAEKSLDEMVNSAWLWEKNISRK